MGAMFGERDDAHDAFLIDRGDPRELDGRSDAGHRAAWARLLRSLDPDD